MANRDAVSDQFLPTISARIGDVKTTFVSMVSSVGAVLAACSCCILPMALAGAGLSTGLSSSLAPLGSLRWPMTVFSILAVAASWFIVLRQAKDDCSCVPTSVVGWLVRPRIIALVIATLLTLIAAAWSLFEPSLMNALM